MPFSPCGRPWLRTGIEPGPPVAGTTTTVAAALSTELNSTLIPLFSAVTRRVQVFISSFIRMLNGDTSLFDTREGSCLFVSLNVCSLSQSEGSRLQREMKAYMAAIKGAVISHVIYTYNCFTFNTF